jgi:hypothetical protein
MKTGQAVGAALLLAGLGADFASAEDVVGASSISTQERSFLDQMSEVTTLTYSGVYRGAPLGNLGSTLQPKVNGDLDETSPQSIENLVTAGYKINKDWMIGVLGHFYYFPIGNPVGTGQDVQMLDPALIINKSNLFTYGNLKINGRFTAQAPLTSADYLVPNELASAMTTTFISTFEVPNTSLTLGIFSYIRGYVPTSDALDTVRTYKLYVAPNANYQLTQNVALTLWVDLVQASRYGGSGIVNLANDPIDIEPGVNWDITKNISINPIINIYPSNPTLASTSLQAFITAKAF